MCCVTAILSKRAMFKFHDVFSIWMAPIIAHFHDRPVQTRTYHFHSFFTHKGNSNTVLSRDGNSSTSFSFNNNSCAL